MQNWGRGGGRNSIPPRNYNQFYRAVIELPRDKEKEGEQYLAAGLAVQSHTTTRYCYTKGLKPNKVYPNIIRKRELHWDLGLCQTPLCRRKACDGEELRSA